MCSNWSQWVNDANNSQVISLKLPQRPTFPWTLIHSLKSSYFWRPFPSGGLKLAKVCSHIAVTSPCGFSFSMFKPFEREDLPDKAAFTHDRTSRVSADWRIACFGLLSSQGGFRQLLHCNACDHRTHPSFLEGAFQQTRCFNIIFVPFPNNSSSVQPPWNCSCQSARAKG